MSFRESCSAQPDHTPDPRFQRAACETGGDEFVTGASTCSKVHTRVSAETLEITLVSLRKADVLGVVQPLPEAPMPRSGPTLSHTHPPWSLGTWEFDV